MTEEIFTTLSLTVDEYAILAALVEEYIVAGALEDDELPEEAKEALYTLYEKACASIGTHPILRLLEGFTTDV